MQLSLVISCQKYLLCFEAQLHLNTHLLKSSKKLAIEEFLHRVFEVNIVNLSGQILLNFTKAGDEFPQILSLFTLRDGTNASMKTKVTMREIPQGLFLTLIFY